MVSLAQKRFAGCLGSKHAGLTFDSEVAVEAAMLRNKANDGLGEMDVEVVADDIPPCVGGGAAQQGVEKTCKVLLGPGVADYGGDFADGDIETGDQGLRAVAAILEFAPLDLARLHRQPRRDALQRLNAGHLVDRDCAMALVGCPASSATPARCAPAPECRSSRRSRLCDGPRRRRLRPGKPHRCRRIWRQRQDRVLASANNESDAV